MIDVNPNIALLVVLCFQACNAETQPQKEYVKLEKEANLPGKLREISGIAHGDNDKTYYVHNDGGSKPALYKIAASDGDIKKDIRIKDVRNRDWEDLAEDSTSIYIGDFGNNDGSRRNLMIYKVDKRDLDKKDEVKPDVIYFAYPHQESFFPRRKHNYDCEAMIVYRDSLYLFSKNRGDQATDVYRLTTEPGRTIAEHVAHFDTQGLITSADILPGKTNMLALLGYQLSNHKYESFLWLFSDFHGTDFFGGRHVRLELAPNLQTEGVLFESDSTLIISSEAGGGKEAKLSSISVKDL